MGWFGLRTEWEAELASLEEQMSLFRLRDIALSIQLAVVFDS